MTLALPVRQRRPSAPRSIAGFADVTTCPVRCRDARSPGAPGRRRAARRLRPPRAALAASNPLQSFESRCEQVPTGRIEISRLPLAVSEDHTVPLVQLARLSEPTSSNHRTVGLTRAKFGYRSTLELDGLEDPKGARACARPQVKVDIEITGTTVYVAREFHGERVPRAVDPRARAVARRGVRPLRRRGRGDARATSNRASGGACATASRWPASRRTSSGSCRAPRRVHGARARRSDRRHAAIDTPTVRAHDAHLRRPRRRGAIGIGTVTGTAVTALSGWPSIRRSA